MKKGIALLLALIISTSLTACVETSMDDIKIPTAVFENDVEKQEVTTMDEIEIPSAVSKNDVEKQEATISETILLDESGVKITAKSLDTDGFMGADLKILIENNSGKDLTFQCRNTSVNGYMIDSMMSVDVVDGKKANDSITFLNADLKTCGIDTIADMEFSFHIFTTDDWESYLDTPQIQLKTSAADTYRYTFDDSGDIAYNEKGIKIVVKGLAENSSIFGPSIIVYLENNSDNNITIQARDVSINGFMVDAIFSSEVLMGKKAIDTITFMSSDLEENEITYIESIELSFHVFETDNWDTIVDTNAIRIDF